MFLKSAVVIVLLASCKAHHDRKFPPHFKFGAATSAYQIEGAWNVSDKGESVWDRYVHEHPELMVHGNGDVATNSYHLWKEDIKMAHALRLDFYRFSISWTRLLPTGLPNVISETGKKYYNDLIDGLLERGIEPLVTIYHWDMPQKLQDLGGWTNPLMIDWFVDYARVVYSLFGDRVKTWITLNEPILICDGIYGMRFAAPRTMETELAPYLCNKHTLIAHAKAWRIYDEEFKPKYHDWTLRTSSVLYKGGWPPSVERVMAEYSKKQGHAKSRLPSFSKEEIDLVRGTYDFYALNTYTSRLVRASRPEDGPRIWFVTGSPELNVTLVVDPDWEYGAVSITPVYPEGVRKQIAWLRSEYGDDLPIMITENGYSSLERDLDDEKRIDFIFKHLEQVLLSIHKDGANVIGYSVWSLMDNFEWMDGYRSLFGLYDVDFSDPLKKRTPRASAHFYAHLIKTRHLETKAKHDSLSHIRSQRSHSHVHSQVHSHVHSLASQCCRGFLLQSMLLTIGLLLIE